jgi:DNA-binding transcriptional LysR family regulator
MTDWENYHSFLELYREGSFAKAARKTGLTHPTIRRRIDDLERRLGVVLFTREADGFSPTPAARQLRLHAEAMESAVQSFLEIASEEAERATGVVKIACGELTAQEILPYLIADLRSRHPGLSLEVVVDTSTAGVLRGAADIAVHLSRPTHKALYARRVGVIHVGLYAHRRYIAAAGTPSSVADLRNFSLIAPEIDGPWISILSSLGAGLTMADFAFRANSYGAQLAAVRAGVGIGAVQSPMVANDPALVRVLAAEVDHELEPWVITHGDLSREPRIRVVYDALVGHMSDYAAGRLGSWGGAPLPPFAVR